MHAQGLALKIRNFDSKVGAYNAAHKANLATTAVIDSKNREFQDFEQPWP